MTNEENLHGEGEANDNHLRRFETCDIDAIKSDAIREVARRWRDSGLEIEAGNQLAGDYVHHIQSGAAVYQSGRRYVVNGPDGESKFDEPRDAAQYALRITEAAKQAGDGE